MVNVGDFGKVHPPPHHQHKKNHKTAKISSDSISFHEPASLPAPAPVAADDVPAVAARHAAVAEAVDAGSLASAASERASAETK